MKDKVPFYEIVNMFFVGSVFTLLTLLLCFNSLPWDLVKDHLSLFSDWTFLISAVLLIAMYEIGFILNKAGSIIITPNENMASRRVPYRCFKNRKGESKVPIDDNGIGPYA